MYRSYELQIIIVPVSMLGAIFGSTISISRVSLSIGKALWWWINEHKEQLIPNSLIWDLRLVPWIHAYDGDIQVSPRA